MVMRTIFFPIFALRVFKSASKTFQRKNTNFAQVNSCNIAFVNFVALKIVVANCSVGNITLSHLFVWFAVELHSSEITENHGYVDRQISEV